MRFAERVEAIWYEKPRRGLLPAMLAAAALLYRLARSIRELSYRIGLKRIRTLPVPCVAVGNLVVGGSGKTPTVAWIASRYREWGRRPAVVSRGYGGSRRGPERVPADRKSGAAALYGDEPVMLARSHPELAVVVGRDRWAAGMKAVRESEADVVVADDAFQNRRLARDLDLVVVDAGRIFGNGRLLPAGPLREPPHVLRRADIVLLTRISSAGESADKCREEVRRLAPGALLAEGDITASRWSRFDGGEVPEPPHGGLFAFCGIANAETFRMTLEEAGVGIRGWESFPDHHPYGKKALGTLARRASDFGAAAAVTTGKDAARIDHWPGQVPLYILEVHLEILRGKDRLEGRLKEIIS